MTTNGINPEESLSQGEWLAAMVIFLLPLFSLVAITRVDLPQWVNYIFIILFWGSILFPLGFALARRLPGWSFPYMGIILMLGMIFNPYWGTFWGWVYPYFLRAFGPSSHWPVHLQIFYTGISEFVMWLTILFGALLLVNLLRLLPYTRPVWDRIRADWTQLSFLLYGGFVLYIMIAFEEYRQEDLWKFGAWVFLALGAWQYLRGKGNTKRILSLILGMTGAFWIVALGKWMLIPHQKWPVGYPTSPSEAARWVETGYTLLDWFFSLGILYAPSLTKWLPPLPVTTTAEEDDPASARTG